MIRKRNLIAIAAAAAVASALLFTDAGAWKCEVHPEKPTCTTTTAGPPVTVNTTIVQSTTTTAPTTSTTAPTTSTTVPSTTTTVPTAPPAPPRLAG